MNLRDKLRAVGGTGKQARPGEAERPAGDCRHIAILRPPEDFPGAMAVRGETAAKLTKAALPEPFDPGKVLYLDTETTGLGGSGTVAFLVGMGYLTEQGFEVHQFLMRDYDEETCLLKHVAAELDRFDMICTFNGATFDLPLLESRFLMNRMDRRCLDKPHLDLLQAARRIWRLRLGRCNLGRLEEVILGTPRKEDLPGSEVPARYFQYLKTRQESLLEDILTHNAQDIASLCVLMTRMAEMYEHPETVAFSEDIYAMGRGLERMNYPEEARKCYRLAARGRMGAEASATLAVSYRRSGERKAASEIWRRMIREGKGGIRPYIELAKYEEHTARNPRMALVLTEKALMMLSEARLREDDAVQEMKNELQYRRRRLKRKLAAEEEKHETGNGFQGE